MKKNFTLFVLAIVAALTFSQKANAQVVDKSTGQIVWFGTTLDQAVELCNGGGYVYLYNVAQGKFLNAGGAYGVHAVLSSIGMRLKIKQTTYDGTTVYTAMGRVDNSAQGSYMSPNGGGNDVYMDRAGTYTTGDRYSRPNWTFRLATGSQVVNGTTYTTNTYSIYNYDRRQYLGLSGTTDINLVNSEYSNWRIISEVDYARAMDDVTWGEVDLGSFLKDADFARDNMDGRYWVWSTNGEGGPAETAEDAEEQTYTKDGYVLTGDNIHWHQRNQDVMCNGVDLAVGPITKTRVGGNVMTAETTDHDSYRNSFAKYYAAEIYNEVNSLKQTLSMTNVENLTSGLYKLQVQALYYDDEEGLTNNEASYLVVEVETPRTDEDGNPVMEDGVQVVDKIIDRLSITPMNKVSNNITPHSGVSAGYVFDNNAEAYVLNFFVELKKTSKLTIGIEQTKAEGWTVIGNIHLYANGKQVLFVDEDWTGNDVLTYQENDQEVTQTGNPYDIIGYRTLDLTYPITVDYQRTMTKNAWNTICLPLPLTGNQVRQSFGDDCVLSEFDGLSGSTVKFKKVDIVSEERVMEAGKPYIIKPTRDPDVAADKSETQQVGNGGNNHTVTVEGPTYYLKGIKGTEYSHKDETTGQWDNILPTYQTITGTVDSSDPDVSEISFRGVLFKKVLGAASQIVDDGGNYSFEANNYWVINKGKMYHLTGTKNYNIWATYAYLYSPKSVNGGGAKDLHLSIDGIEEEITAIEGLFAEPTAIEDNAVYTLNGQKVGGAGELSSMPKGVYIVNGKKYVVK